MNERGYFAQGCQFFAVGNYSAAENLFRHCLRATPENPDVLNALGSALDALGSLDDAAYHLKQACRLRPECAPFHFNRANLLRRCRDEPGAEHAYLEAIQCDPVLAEAYHGLGSLYLEEGKLEPAGACLQRAINLKKDFVPALHDLGQLRQTQGVQEEAERYYRLSVAGDTAFLPALNSLGMLLLRKGRVAEARHCFEQAIKTDRNYLQARCNLAVLDTWCGNLDYAIALLQQAVKDAPNDGNIHYNLALALLAAGRFKEGWREHEWRFGKSSPVPMRYAEIPRWHGELLAGKSILIHAEQGYGDSLQFIRFAQLLASQGATVLVEGQDQFITPLLAMVEGVAVAFSRNDELSFMPDYQIPMMSLPLGLGIEAAHPTVVRYLRPPEETVRFWHDTLFGMPGLKVGLAWSGRPEHENDANRSISSEQLAPLCGLHGISWVNLQFGSHKPPPPPISLFDPADRVVDFCDSAALIAGLDLVITVDSAIAHLAGGIGVPVMLLLPWNPDWRWMHNRLDSPWYPATRIYRQKLGDAWEDTVGCVVADLSKSLKNGMVQTTVNQIIATEIRNDELSHNALIPGGPIIIDGVFFQYHITGIARVWLALLKELSGTSFASQVIILDRGKTTLRIEGYHYLDIPRHNESDIAGERKMLQRVCDDLSAALFISTWHTCPLVTPSLLMIHDLLPEILLGEQRFEAGRWQEKKMAIEHAQAFIAVSENSAKDLVTWYPEAGMRPIHVIHNGVSSAFRPATSERIRLLKESYGITKPYFLFVGPREWYKNFRLLLDAFMLLPDPHAYCIVSPHGNELEEEFTGHPGSVFVKLTGRLSDEDLVTAYSGAEALVYPSHYEGFGLPPLEAMACGSPVIISTAPALVEVCRDAAIQVKSDDSEALAGAMMKLNYQEYRIRYVRLGLERASRFSWKQSASQLLRVISGLFGDRPGNFIHLRNEDPASAIIHGIYSTISAYRKPTI